MPIVAAIAFVGLNSFTDESEYDGKYGTCDKANNNKCEICDKKGNTILRSTGAWTSPS